jgi:glycosyltransferase involved in cell wall biosynthesis
MKIAWLCPYPVHEMGSEIEWKIRKETFHSCGWIVNLQKALVQMPDVELHVFTLHHGISRTQCVRLGGAFFHIVKNGVPFLHKGFPKYFPVDALTGFAGDVALLKKEVRKINPDVVHAHGTENAYALTAAAMKYPSVISMQGIIAEINKVNPTFRFRKVEKLERKALLKTKYASCRTAFDTGFVSKTNPSAHIFQIQEAMNPVYFEKQWNGCARKRILFVGSMGKHKGLETLFQAVKSLTAEDPDVELCVVGGTPGQIEMCKQRCLELGISRQVEFAGFLNAAAIVPHHLACKVFVIPSTNENSPNTLAEAMVSGMPCVASAVGGIPSMVDDEKTGLLFRSEDAGGLVRQLKRVLYDDKLCRELGTAAAATARSRHRPENVAKETMAAYEFILQNERGRESV